MILAHLQKLSWKHALDIELAQAERNIDKKSYEGIRERIDFT